MQKLKNQILEVKSQDKKLFNKLAPHPLQTWEWGEFRQKTGIQVIRLGKYVNNQLTETVQMTIHYFPYTSWTIGYLPKSKIPSEEMLEKLIEIAKKNKCIFIKIEPNIVIDKKNTKPFPFNLFFPIVSSPHPLFPKYTFQLDLTKSEEELLKNMHPKTRYNIKVAQKHGVIITEDNSQKAFNAYLQLLKETTKRQNFYAHDEKYHQLMWETLKVQDPKIKGGNDFKDRLTAHLLTAVYQGKIAVAWILFLHNNILYYPYGASSNQYRNIMASNLMMWETIRFGKKRGAKIFDLWGALGPNPHPNHPWYGFHRFKLGYGPKLIEFIGSYDLVINPYLYRLYNLIYKIREKILKFKI